MSANAASRNGDCAARLAAQTVFDRPLALEAGAGTGKTATLVGRIVAWSVGPGWEREAAEAEGSPEEIAGKVLDGVVAVTFTDDAAAEMAGRVAQTLAALERWEGATEPSSECPRMEELVAGRAEDRAGLRGIFRCALPEDGDAVGSRSRALLTQIERLRASTIHSFASTILSRFPIEAGLHPGFTVDAEEVLLQELVEAAVEEILAGAYAAGEEDAAALAESGLGPAEITGTALALARAGTPLEALAEDPFTEEAVAPLLAALAAEVLPARADAEAYAEKPKLIGAGGRLLVALADLVGGLGAVPATELAEDVARAVRSAARENAIHKVGDWARGKLNKPMPEDLSEDDFIAHMNRLLPLLKLLESYDPTTFNRLRRLLLPILRRVREEQHHHGIVIFHDLLVRARKVLEEEAPVRSAIRSEIRQLLVDEMQDTDKEQARIVRLLALENPGDDPPCLFLVGDPKQSIYGWRSADLAVYEELVEAVVSAGGERYDLVVNFRSAPAVLEEVERLMEPVMVRRAGLQPAFIPLEPCSRLRADPGYRDNVRGPVEHWATVKAEDGSPGPTSAGEAARLEAEAVARDVAALHAAGEPLSGMAVLMRSRGKLETFLAALREHGIAYNVGKDRSYFRTREIAEAMALIRLVLDPFDPLALTAILRSPVVGVPDCALSPLWAAGLPGLAAALPPGAGPLPPELDLAVGDAASTVEALGLEIPGLEELAGWPDALRAFLDVVARLRASFADDPPDVFLETLRETTLLEPLAAGRFPGHYRLANVDRFLRSFEDLLLSGSTSGAILRWLRRMSREQPDEPGGRPREDAGDAVRVLTIHGAKGLEFDHVWLVQTHSGSGSGPGPSTHSELHDGSWRLCLAGYPSPAFPALLERRNQVEEAERVRLLYVALTRAKKRLVTSGCWKKTRGGNDGTLLGLLRKRQSTAGAGPGGWPDLADIWDEAGPARIPHDGALWVLPGHPAWDKATPRAQPRAEAAAPYPADRIRKDAQTLHGLRHTAAERAARRWLAGVSDEAHRRLAEAIAVSVEGGEPSEEDAAPRVPVPRDVAAAVGTAIHQTLERFDLDATDPGAELASRRAEAAAWLETALPTEMGPTAKEHLRAILESFCAGPLWKRWLLIRNHVLARELPVLLPPGDGPDAPVGALTGFIDLLYRDPDTGDLVVADFKTDAPEHLEERAAAYAHQLTPYTRAVQAALGLATPPRSELWFLAAGKLVVPNSSSLER
ncbi:MAG: UvrD-helicase domain-containing protein [Thermoanaerobaculales bacterium]